MLIKIQNECKQIELKNECKQIRLKNFWCN